MQQHLAWRFTGIEREIRNDAFVHAVMAVEIVLRVLVVPDCLAGVRAAGKNAAGPLVVAGPHVGIPTGRVASAMEDQVLFRIIADPSPDSAPAQFPLLTRP